MTQEATMPECLQKYDVKIEDTAKGIRLCVHARDDEMFKAASDAVTLYEVVQKRLEENGHMLAPVESPKVKAPMEIGGKAE